MIQLNSLPGQVLDNKYRIERLLGRGGMGAVYLAQHLGTRRMVALKVIVPNRAATTEYLERFRREAEAAGMLRHPNVVDVTDFGVTDVDGSNIAYLVMEYLDGCDLQMILAEEHRLPIPFAVEILQQTCSAVAEAHRRGIIHRDLKPANIWLEPDRIGGYSVKVLDFGLAKTNGVTSGMSSPGSAVSGSQESGSPVTGSHPGVDRTPSRGEPPKRADVVPVADDVDTIAFPPKAADGDEHVGSTIGSSRAPVIADTISLSTVVQKDAETNENAESLTRIGSIMGSPGYMSPEQCRGEAVDWRSDIYSIGVIAYEMLTGAKPIAGGDMRAIIKQTVEEPPAPLQTFRPELPDSVCNVVLSALEKDPNDRPQSATVFVSTLHASAMGIGELLKLALTKFTENVQVFLKVFIAAYVPFFLLRLFINHFAISTPSAPRRAGMFLVLVIIGIIGNFIAAALARGLSAVIYSYSLAMPASTVAVRALIARLHATTAPTLLRASFAYFGMVTLPMVVFGWSLLFVFFDADRLAADGVISSALQAKYAAVAFAAVSIVLLIRNLPRAAILPIVVLVEGRSHSDSMSRTRTLSALAPRLIIGLGVIETLVWLVFQTIRYVALSLIVYQPMRQFGAPLVANIEAVEIGAVLLSMALEIIIGPLLALVYAAVYLKLRLGNGETVESMVSDQFVLADVPKTKWQQRMQSRLGSQHSGAHDGESGRRPSR